MTVYGHCAIADEQIRRRWAGAEALAMGRGGVSARGGDGNVPQHSFSRPRFRSCRAGRPIGQERIRRPGGGRRALAAEDASLSDLTGSAGILDAWRSDQPLAVDRQEHTEARRGVGCTGTCGQPMRVPSPGAVGLQPPSNRKTREGELHPDRDGQFEHLNAKCVGSSGAESRWCRWTRKSGKFWGFSQSRAGMASARPAR